MPHLGRRLTLALLGVILGVGVTISAAGARLPMPFGIGAAVVLSGSMEPALSVHDVVILRASDTYEAGDIVVYQSGSALVVHRVIARDSHAVTTQGDANNAADPPVEVSHIKGKVIARIPKLGVAITALKTPTGLLLALLAVFALTGLSFRKKRDEDEGAREAIREEIQRLKQEGKE